MAFIQQSYWKFLRVRAYRLKNVRSWLEKHPVTLVNYKLFIAQIFLIILTHFIFNYLTYLQCLLLYTNFT